MTFCVIIFVGVCVCIYIYWSEKQFSNILILKIEIYQIKYIWGLKNFGHVFSI